MSATLRGLSSTLTAVMLVAALAGGECASCGIGSVAPSENSGCCTPDGHCKASTHKAPPARCLKGHVDGALIEQAAQVHPAIVHFDLPQPIEAVTQQYAAPVNLHICYSPPDFPILNSALLI
jgi:hypothetical protein